MKNNVLSALACLVAFAGYAQKRQASLIPAKPSAAADYFCTWNVQGYVVSYSSTPATRQAVNEKSIFGNGKFEGWAHMFAKLHQDLFLVLDDDWETPLNGDRNYYGSLIVDDERFPSVKGMSPVQKLTVLSDKAKQLGWKGLGLWICAQQAPRYKNNDDVAYWTERFNWMNKAGIAYWKVDWGQQEKNAEWRASLTKLGQQFAPNLTIEQAMTPTALSTAATYRTYDVENIIAVPHTIDRVGKLLTALPKGQAVSVINCEDEPYIAAGLGCATGIMRHEYNGKLPDGRQDYAFPPVGRDLKSRLDEVTRCVMWHRIALPFGINKTSVFVDTTLLHDYWIVQDRETWMDRPNGYKNAWQAPAVITRGLDKPTITLQKGDTIKPYILASKYPNGAIAIASIGRTIGREYITPRVDVTLKADALDKPFGIFGHYNNLTIVVTQPAHFTKVLAQDLAGTTPVDITRQIVHHGNKITIPGTIIDKVGLSAATKGDKSEPGMVVVFR